MDMDGDGFGSYLTTESKDKDCDDPGESWSDEDCNDADDSVYPGAEDLPGDGWDKNCDGEG